MPHRNVPIFIPHMGCPHTCVFCNQRSISGHHAFRLEDVTREIEAALSTIPTGTDTEIAFFGGSFTGIDRDLMVELLELAERYVRAGRVSSIRLSTRPDYISQEILEILSRYSVKTIELGLQSMNDNVLLAAGRGHSAACAAQACRAVVRAGFSLVGQMMIGLPGATLTDEIETAKQICKLGASAARIYPTVVFYDTPLCEMTRAGRYLPLSLREAVERSAAVLRIFTAHGVPCIRIGLCAGEGLSSPETVMAGPNHAALGELVLGELYYEKLIDALNASGLLGREVLLQLPAREISKYVGQHRVNLERLLRETNTRVVKTVGKQNLCEPCPILWQGAHGQQEEEQPCI